MLSGRNGITDGEWVVSVVVSNTNDRLMNVIQNKPIVGTEIKGTHNQIAYGAALEQPFELKVTSEGLDLSLLGLMEPVFPPGFEPLQHGLISFEDDKSDPLDVRL